MATFGQRVGGATFGPDRQGHWRQHGTYRPPAAQPRRGYKYLPDRQRYPAGSKGPYGQSSYSPGTRAVPGNARAAFGRALAEGLMGGLNRNKAALAKAALDLGLGFYQWWSDGDPQGWGTTVGKIVPGDFPFGSGAPPGWNLDCNVSPNPLETKRKQGVMPAALGDGTVVGSTCNVSTINRSNLPWASDIPAGATMASLVCSGVDYPNHAGRPYWVISRPGGVPSTSPLRFGYAPRATALPVADPLQETSTLPASYGQPQHWRGGIKPYQSEVQQVVIEKGKPPVSGPGIHDHLPPDRDTKEDKPMMPGRTLSKVFGGITEVEDALDCLEKNIKFPKGSRFGMEKQPLPARGTSGHEKLQSRAAWVLDQVSRGHLDVAGFAECFAQNQLTDSLVGGLAGPAARNLNRAWHAYGGRGVSSFGRGGFGTRMR